MLGHLKSYHKRVAAEILTKIKAGTAPWMRPWKPGQRSLPRNILSTKEYRGGNSTWLSCAEFQDTRWGTYKQLQTAGGQVQKGSKSRHILYWQFETKRRAVDKNGKPKFNDAGEPVYVYGKLDRPRCYLYHLFNVEQCEGIEPEPEPEPPDWEEHETSETILTNSLAKIRHLEGNRAYYRPSADLITMPLRNQFANPPLYYQTILHELAHWTGADTRLAREGITNPKGKGSPTYAQEELRAEIASMMLSNHLGIGHDPIERSAAYVEGWLKVIENNPKEVYDASRDAQSIVDFILKFKEAA